MILYIAPYLYYLLPLFFLTILKRIIIRKRPFNWISEIILLILPYPIWCFTFFVLGDSFVYLHKSLSNMLLEPFLLGALTGILSFLCDIFFQRYLSKKQNTIIKVIISCMFAIIIAIFLPGLDE